MIKWSAFPVILLRNYGSSLSLKNRKKIPDSSTTSKINKISIYLIMNSCQITKKKKHSTTRTIAVTKKLSNKLRSYLPRLFLTSNVHLQQRAAVSNQKTLQPPTHPLPSTIKSTFASPFYTHRSTIQASTIFPFSYLPIFLYTAKSAKKREKDSAKSRATQIKKMAQTLSKRKQQKKINIQSEKDLPCRSVVEMYCRSRWTEMKNVTIRNCQKKVINYSY